MTQEKLADLAGLASRHVQKIEAGEVNLTLQSLAVLAEVLAMDPSELLSSPDESGTFKREA